ncbi:MAG: AI-2E family transporter [Betaproteobacteria bacterium]|nr:AI-2E family transporter [Betaproteobacteria bacterium]
MDDEYARQLARRIILGLMLGGLVWLGYAVLQWFIVPVTWAIILAYVSWPLYRRVRSLFWNSANGSALLMTLILAAAVALPGLWLLVLLRDELAVAYRSVAAYLAQGPQPLPGFIAGLPWVGEWLQELLNRIAGNPESLRAQFTQWGEQWLSELGQVVGSVGRNAAKLGFAVLTVFFLYRDGESVLDQVRRVLRRFLGSRVDGYLVSVGRTTKAVLFGLVLTALAQGVLAGLGYWVAGVQNPVLLGTVTALIALIPFGTPFAWGSIGVWLLITGQTLAGVGLLLWGALVVSGVDNLIRPLVISRATRIPFLPVIFGVVGGVLAFGLIGLFVGPVILAVLITVWCEWCEEQEAGRAVGAGDSPPHD